MAGHVHFTGLQPALNLECAGRFVRKAATRVAALEGRGIPTTAIVVDLLDPSWLVEIEVVAMG